MPFKDPDALAEKLDRYADSLTAFAVLQTGAFLLGLLNKDFREGIFKLGPAYAYALLTFLLGSIIFLLMGCFSGQDALLGKPFDLPSPLGKWIFFTRVWRLLIVLGALAAQGIVFHFLNMYKVIPTH